MSGDLGTMFNRRQNFRQSCRGVYAAEFFHGRREKGEERKAIGEMARSLARLTGNGDEQEEYPRIHESAGREEATATASWEGSPPVHHAPRCIADPDTRDYTPPPSEDVCTHQPIRAATRANHREIPMRSQPTSLVSRRNLSCRVPMSFFHIVYSHARTFSRTRRLARWTDGRTDGRNDALGGRARRLLARSHDVRVLRVRGLRYALPFVRVYVHMYVHIYVRRIRHPLIRAEDTV